MNKKSNTSKDELKRECENSNDRFFVCFDDSENIYSIYSTLCFEKDGQVISLGEQAEVSYDVNNREYSSNFTGEWYGLPDGQLLTTYVIDKGEGVIVYGIPVVINEVESIIRIYKQW